jgi:peptidoglycan hydrolase CwlO-like protein
MTQNVFLIVLFGSLGTVLLLSVVTLFVAIGLRREARHISKDLDGRHSWLESELERAQQDLSKAQQQVQQLEEESPEKLKWELQHVTEELERFAYNMSIRKPSKKLGNRSRSGYIRPSNKSSSVYA